MRTILPRKARLIPENAELVFKGVIFDVYQWQQKLFDGTESTFEMLRRPSSLWVIAVKDGKIVVADEQQPGSQLFLTLPSGRHDIEGESELNGAKRELKEETGMTFSSWKLLNVTQMYPKIEWFSFIFLATDFVSQEPQQLDSGEKITIKLLSLGEIKLQNEKFRYVPQELLISQSVEEIINLPEYQP